MEVPCASQPGGGRDFDVPIGAAPSYQRNPNEGMRLKMPPEKKPRPGVLPRLSFNLDDLADLGDEQEFVPEHPAASSRWASALSWKRRGIQPQRRHLVLTPSYKREDLRPSGDVQEKIAARDVNRVRRCDFCSLLVVAICADDRCENETCSLHTHLCPRCDDHFCPLHVTHRCRVNRIAARSGWPLFGE